MRIQFMFGSLAILGASSIFACSAPAPADPGSADSETKAATKEADKKAPSSPSSGAKGSSSSSGGSSSGETSSSGGPSSDGGSSSGGGGTTPAACATMPTYNACHGCCEDANPGAQAKIDAAVKAVEACQCAPEACQAECPNDFFCGGNGGSTETCWACLQSEKTAACGPPYQAAWKDPLVVALTQCLVNSKCTDKTP